MGALTGDGSGDGYGYGSGDGYGYGHGLRHSSEPTRRRGNSYAVGCW